MADAHSKTRARVAIAAGAITLLLSVPFAIWGLRKLYSRKKKAQNDVKAKMKRQHARQWIESEN
jgi:hypothetical protein